MIYSFGSGFGAHIFFAGSSFGLKKFHSGSKSNSKHETGFLSSKFLRTSGCRTPMVPIFWP